MCCGKSRPRKVNRGRSKLKRKIVVKEEKVEDKPIDTK